MVLLLKIIAVITGIATIRKVWHDGTISKQQAEKLRLENQRMRRGG
ncbi:hypothetical protein [Siminovitchia terrae]|nr:hypothetical protein [Siminovitchia terrae]